MTQSQRVAGLLGPTLMATVASEFPLVQPRLYDEQIPPVVYLSGVLMFVASAYRQASDSASPAFFMALEGVLFATGLVMTVEAYTRSTK